LNIQKKVATFIEIKRCHSKYNINKLFWVDQIPKFAGILSYFYEVCRDLVEIRVEKFITPDCNVKVWFNKFTEKFNGELKGHSHEKVSEIIPLKHSLGTNKSSAK
jgi:hypothetical protein